jgi:peroxiredoxin
MRHRSPILDHIEGMDESAGERKEPKKKPRKEKPPDDDWDTGGSPHPGKHYKSFLEEDEDEEDGKGSKQSGPGLRGIVSTFVSILLIVGLIFGAVYIYNNFDSLTKILAAPTTTETPRPSGQAPSSNAAQPAAAPSFNPLAWFSGLFASHTPAAVPTTSSNTTSSPAVQPASPPVTQPAAQPAPPVAVAPPATPADTTLPVIYEPVVKAISDRGATVAWKTSEPCISEIHFKTNLGETRIQKVSLKPSLDHSIALSNLDSGQTYYVKLQCHDNSGNVAKPVERTFQTLLITADITPPKLIGQPSVSVDDTTATVTWQTDEKAKSQVKFGLGAGFEFPSAFTNDFGTGQSLFLSGLSPSTTYRYKLISRDTSGNTMESQAYEFRTEPETGAAPYISSRAPNFTLKDLKGETISLSQFRGKKVILNFWASWCTPCKMEAPHFQALWDKVGAGGDVMLVTVAGSQSEEEMVRSFITNGNYSFTVLLDPGEDAFNKYELTSIPKTYFIDKDGVIRRMQQGMFTSPSEIEFMLNSY